MGRWLLFLALVGSVTAYSFWIYLRVDLAVPAARTLAVVRAIAMIVVLMLLFDLHLPLRGVGGEEAQWVLLDTSLSMSVSEDRATPGDGARARADELEAQGWKVVTFGGWGSLLAPALATAAEGGAREVRVLSDLRFADAVAARAALADLPLDVTFEEFGVLVANVGLSRFEVPDLARPEGTLTSELEVHGGVLGDSVHIEILEEDRVVATTTVAAVSPGLRSTVRVELPSPAQPGRVRYVARVSIEGDAFDLDDSAVAYATVGHQEGAVVLVSVSPDWEPRYLLPVLGEVTGLPTAGYLRAGPDRFVRLGAAIERGDPVDAETVRRAASDASILVVHGVGVGAVSWITDLAGRPGRRLLLPGDAEGAALVGLEVGPPTGGEWYVSPDVPTSPIAGALAGVSLQGLPPLTDVMVPARPSARPPLQLQLRGAGAPDGAFELIDREAGRVAVALASGFWRWAMRETGREAYRRVWSGIAGWLLADREVLSAEPRPTSWVVARGEAVLWSIPGDSGQARVLVTAADSVVTDTVLSVGREVSTGSLPPDSYGYVMFDASGDTTSVGRFDVSGTTEEMLPVIARDELSAQKATLGVSSGTLGRPLRTFSWPYLLVIMLLCGEWIFRRRSGLR